MKNRKMKNRKKRDEVKVILSSRAGTGKIVSLIKDGADGSYAVTVTHCDEESRRSIIVAFGIVDFDDARLIFDRQSKIIFDEVYYEIKGT